MQAIERIRAALEIGLDDAKEVAATYSVAMAGYRPHRHAAYAKDVADIEAALAEIPAVLAHITALEAENERLRAESEERLQNCAALVAESGFARMRSASR